MTLDEEIEWWTKQAYRPSNGAWMLAFGVATGLKLAKADYEAKQEAKEAKP